MSTHAADKTTQIERWIGLIASVITIVTVLPNVIPFSAPWLKFLATPIVSVSLLFAILIVTVCLSVYFTRRCVEAKYRRTPPLSRDQKIMRFAKSLSPMQLPDYPGVDFFLELRPSRGGNIEVYDIKPVCTTHNRKLIIQCDTGRRCNAVTISHCTAKDCRYHRRNKPIDFTEADNQIEARFFSALSQYVNSLTE